MKPAILIWLILTAGIGFAVVVTKKKRRQPLPSSEQFVVMALAVGGLIVSSQVFYKGCTSEALYKLLDWDGTVGLLIGSGFATYLAGKEIIKLF
jgi:hypothetical protein